MCRIQSALLVLKEELKTMMDNENLSPSPNKPPPKKKKLSLSLKKGQKRFQAIEKDDLDDLSTPHVYSSYQFINCQQDHAIATCINNYVLWEGSRLGLGIWQAFRGLVWLCPHQIMWPESGGDPPTAVYQYNTLNNKNTPLHVHVRLIILEVIMVTIHLHGLYIGYFLMWV